MEPTLLFLGAGIFVIVLIFILRSAQPNGPSPQKDKKSQQQPVKQKQKKGRTSLKKNERPEDTKEWTGVDTPAKDAQEVLEFLKGKDPVHIAKLNAVTLKQGRKKEKAKEEVQSSEDSASEDASTEGFENVVKKKPSDKKKKKKKKETKETKEGEDAKAGAPKPFYRPLGEDGQPIKDEKKEKKKKQQGEGGDKKPREPREKSDGERRERKPQSEGEDKQGEKREKREGGSDVERPKREVRRPITSPPNVKQEETADLNDILNSITQGYKAKPEIRRVSSAFSRLERRSVMQILSKLEAHDLVALSAVNHYFMGAARRDVLWKDLLARDFGLKDVGKARNFRAAYRVEHKKKYPRKNKKEEIAVPQSEEKDVKVEAPKGGKERKDKKGESTTTESAKE